MRGQAQFLGGAGAKPQNPFRQPSGVKQFARIRNAAHNLAIRVAGVCFIKTAQRGLETFWIARLKMSVTGWCYSKTPLPAQGGFWKF